MDEKTAGPEDLKLAATPASRPRQPWTASRVAITFVAAITLLRVAVLLLAFVNLGPEEAQYWAWAQHLAFGYFSKPPMIAWLIAGTTAICGDGEACVRISAPLLHGGTALLIFFLARRLYDVRTAAWAAISFATLPAVFLSSGLITTDVPLVFAWAGALYSYDRLIEVRERGTDAYKWAAITGLAIGLGLLSKYVMVYFFLCAALHMALSPRARKALLSPAGVLVLLVALLVFSPNLIWNIQDGFETLNHTTFNANWKGHIFNIGKLGEFVGSQSGVFGPVLLVMYLLGAMTLRKRMASGPPGADLFLFLFSAPVLVIACTQAFISRANANWAAPAYIAATILVIAWIVRDGERLWLNVWRLKSKVSFLLWLSLVIHLISGISLYTFITVRPAVKWLEVENSFKRLRGWDTLAAEVGRVSAGAPDKAIMTNHRMVTAELNYYGRKLGLPIVSFDEDREPENEFELKAPYTPEIGGPVLFVTWDVDASKVLQHFQAAEPLEVFRMERGRTPPPAPPAQLPWMRPYAIYDLPFYIYRLDGFTG